MILKTVPAFALSAKSSIKTRRKAPFVVVPPCQSEIKRTLRRASCVGNGLAFSEHSNIAALRSMQMVNVGFPKTVWIWFRKGGCGRGGSV